MVQYDPIDRVNDQPQESDSNCDINFQMVIDLQTIQHTQEDAKEVDDQGNELRLKVSTYFPSHGVMLVNIFLLDPINNDHFQGQNVHHVWNEKAIEEGERP